jgi:eukaryotic-like serine/threonine-protein kinase
MPEIPPTHIGKYRVLSELGRGATSTVYLAEDAFHKRKVAIKVVKAGPATDSELQRRYKRVFINESSLAGRLSHPHIVAIYDAADDGEQTYIVMEHVQGGTLEQYISPEALLPLPRLVEIAFKASVALDYAYRHGVIHCDIKPANILIHGDTDIKISDFGAAYVGAAEHTFLTGVGSPAYMSPEQIQDRQVTHQTDIYSLGVVMYQMLTGRLPFSGSSRGSLLYQIVNIDPAPPSTLRRGLTTELDRIVLRALAKSTSDRYATWGEFSRDLALAFRHLSLPDESTSDTEKFSSLRAISMLRDFRDVELWELLRIAAWRRVPAETTILREGDESDVLYVLVEGEATVSRRGVRLDTLQVGQCFGDIQYFETVSGQRSTTIASTLPCTLLEVQAAHLRQASDALQMQLNRAFIRLLVSRLDARDHRLIQQAGAQAA